MERLPVLCGVLLLLGLGTAGEAAVMHHTASKDAQKQTKDVLSAKPSTKSSGKQKDATPQKSEGNGKLPKYQEPPPAPQDQDFPPLLKGRETKKDK